MVDALWAVALLPLLGAISMLVVGSRLPTRLPGIACTGTVLASFLLSVLAVLGNGGASKEAVLFEWLPLLGADCGYLLDPLSSVMLLVVTGIGTLVHLYSIGYMEHDRALPRYFGYLNLFVFFMLTLVLANNYVLAFVGWEGVGLCSYLLIGYDYRRQRASSAGMKAFLVNRFADWGLLLGILLLWSWVGTIRFTEVPSALQQFTQEANGGALTLIALLLFIGAAGKSAQFPLHVWLPDAMEGPTPVSALIHAATMVTAGVYLIARSSQLYNLTPWASELMAGLGAFTALFAASVALVQTDIKRILAYSTISQLGFMFMALGVGAYWIAIFHLLTHAFFKALLFLGSGSVIHAMNGEQDIRRMGGLRKLMPATYACMLIGTLAIAGIPGFAGFFSKEEILAATLSRSSAFFAVGLITSGLTAYYMWRLMRLTFFGSLRSADLHPHESPLIMTFPMLLLAAGSVLSGWPHKFIAGYLRPVFPLSGGDLFTVSTFTGYSIAVAAVLSAVAGMFLARHEIKGRFTTLLSNAYYVDSVIHQTVVVGLVQKVGPFLGRFDNQVVDGGVNGSAWMARLYSRALIAWDVWVIDGLVRSTFLIRLAGYPTRLLQTGQVQTYALVVVIGALAMFGYYVARS
jgi:NADH-quinone oxidoreductase subunit L